MSAGGRRKENEPCRACADAVDHCHGSVVVHTDGSVECSEVKCIDVSESRHAYVLSCSVVVHSCGCRETDAALH